MTFRRAYDRLCQEHRELPAVKHYLRILEAAKYDGQDHAEEALRGLLRNSQLLSNKTWQQFQWSWLPLPVVRQFEKLRTGRFLDQRANVLIFGKPGSGKTNLLCALADELARQGRTVLFTTCQLLVQQLVAAEPSSPLFHHFRMTTCINDLRQCLYFIRRDAAIVAPFARLFHQEALYELPQVNGSRMHLSRSACGGVGTRRRGPIAPCAF